MTIMTMFLKHKNKKQPEPQAEKQFVSNKCPSCMGEMDMTNINKKVCPFRGTMLVK